MSDGRSSALVDRVRSLAEPVLADLGIELVEVQFRREANGWVLRLFIDTEAGVTIEDCATASREIGALLEVEDFVGPAYQLEVSSPGLDRPLKKEADFVRFVGRKARVKTKEPIDQQQVFTGVLEKGEAGIIRLVVDKRKIEIPVANIAKARLEIEF